jgi:RecA/RadA recombinase
MIEVSGWECLAGETLIDCPRDLDRFPKGIPIKNLVGTKPWVYGFDQKLGRIVLRQASCVWKVGKRPVYKVTFQVPKNSVRIYGKQPEFIIATASHPFMLRERSTSRSKYSSAYDWESQGYRKLSDLKPGDRIMPFFRKLTNGHSVIHLNNGENFSEHRFILSEIYGDRPTDEWDGHHKDENDHNHSVDNLEWKTCFDHLSYHATKRNLEGRSGWQKYGIHPRGMLGKPQTAKCRNAASKLCRERNAREDSAWIKKNKITTEKLRKLYTEQGLTLEQLGKEINASGSRARNVLKLFSIPMRDRYWHQRQQGNNHKVKKVEFYGYEDVYDMTVPGIDNFVANGVVVHNSQGKSALVMSIAALAQYDGAHVVYGDVENSFDPGWARVRGMAKCPHCNGTGTRPTVKDPAILTECISCGGPEATTAGLDVSKLTLVQPYVGQFSYVDKKTGKTHQEKNPRLSTAQELCSEIEASMQQKGHTKRVVVLDSIAALLTEGESLTGLEDANMRTNMDLPLFMGRLLRRWVGCAQVHNALIILVNQLREGPKSSFGDSSYTPGGNAPKFYSHVRVRVHRVAGSKIMDKGEVIGIRGIMKCLKNKTGGGESSEIGYRLLFNGPLEFVPADDVKKKEGE